MERSETKQGALTTHLRQLHNDLQHIIDIQFGLLDELRGMGVLNHQQIGVIRCKPRLEVQLSQLLDDVVNSSRNVQKQFLLALYKTGQKHVNNYIISGGRRTATEIDNWPLFFSKEFNIFQANWPKLIELIDSKYGLLDELVSVMCITKRHKAYLEVAETSDMKNERLLFIMQYRSVGDYRNFIRCLVKTKQQHVAFLLDSDATGDARPLNDVQRSRLTVNHASLVSLIDTRNGLLAEMFSADCITRRQKEAIESAATQSDSNTLLLNIVDRGSESDFNKFVVCLSKTGQQHVSRLLLEECFVTQVVARFTDAKSLTHTLLYSREAIICSNLSENIKQYETSIVELIMTALKIDDVKRRQELNPKVSELINQLSSREIHLIAANTQQSVALFFICDSLKGLLCFDDLHFSGQLQATVIKLFALLFNEATVKCSSCSWDISEYTRGVNYFCTSMGLSVFTELYHQVQNIHGCTTERCMRSFRIEQLPFELIEMVLINAASQLFVKMNRVTPRAAIYTLAALSAVSLFWWRTLTYRQYNKHKLKRYFKYVCRPFKCYPQQFPSLHIKGGVPHVCGLAVSNNKLYVACVGSDTIQVYTIKQPFSQLEDIKVEGLNNPRDIIVCSETSQLYIADWEQCAVWRVNLLSYKQVDKFITTQWPPRSLSIKSRRLLITPADGDALFIYGDDGVQLNRISLPDYMVASHAMESSRNTYIVSHWNILISDMQSEHKDGVSEVGVDGRIIRHFNNQLDASLQLNGPNYLLIDASNHVIVADMRNERIVLLKPDLQLKRVLIPKLQGQPARMCFNEETGLLFVSSWRSTAITITKICRNLLPAVHHVID